MEKTVLLFLLPGLLALASCTKTVDPAAPAAQNTPVPGRVWTESSRAAAFAGRYIHAGVVYDNAMWVIGGAVSGGAQAGDVWYSMDGTYWQEATANAAFGPRQGHTCVVFDSGDGSGPKMWIIGGAYSNGNYCNDIWNSSNGVDWTPVTQNAEFSPRCGHSCVVYDDGTGPKMYVICGHQGSTIYNDIWYSSDGISWTQGPNVNFSARYYHSSVVYNNEIWVIGGVGNISGNYIYKNDVWTLPRGGSSWTQVTSSAAFGVRYLHASVVYDDKMWVIGGSNNSDSYYNDAWYSSDGSDWIAATQNAGFSPREGLNAVIFNNAICITAGAIEASGLYYNDVWKSL